MTSTRSAKHTDKFRSKDLKCHHAAAINHRLAWVPLYDGKYVDGVLYQRVKLEVVARIPDLPRGAFLTTKKICSPEFWESLESGEKRMAGRCLMHFVLNKEVGLSLSSRNSTGPQLYCKT